ncbi:MAG: hypothetical protein ABIH23_19735 [bacterium]
MTNPDQVEIPWSVYCVSVQLHRLLDAGRRGTLAIRLDGNEIKSVAFAEAGLTLAELAQQLNVHRGSRSEVPADLEK